MERGVSPLAVSPASFSTPAKISSSESRQSRGKMRYKRCKAPECLYSEAFRTELRRLSDRERGTRVLSFKSIVVNHFRAMSV